MTTSLAPLIDSTERILKLIPDQKYRKTKLYTSTPLGHVRLLSANVIANRNSKTLERITADESWAYKDEEKWLEQIHSRQNSFNWQWQMFLPSSGQTEGSELDQLWQRSSQHTGMSNAHAAGKKSLIFGSKRQSMVRCRLVASDTLAAMKSQMQKAKLTG